MAIRRVTIFFLLVLVVRQSAAKDKKHLPDDLLKAQTVAIVISVDPREVATNPNVQETLQKELETAMVNWGRYTLAPAATADLLIVAHMGHVNPPNILSRPDQSPINPNTGPTPYPGTPGLATPSREKPDSIADQLRESKRDDRSQLSASIACQDQNHIQIWGIHEWHFASGDPAHAGPRRTRLPKAFPEVRAQK